MVLKRAAFILFLLAAIASETFGTHLRAGEITVKRIGCTGLIFEITVSAFTNTKGTTILFGDAYLDLGDNSKPAYVPEIPNTIRYDLDPSGGIATASYTIRHEYGGPGKYLISYKEPNRNEGVLNMDNSVDTEFYIETLIYIDPFLGCDNSPQLSVPPIDRGCVGVAWFHNPGAYDPDGDSLSYELVVPFQDRNTTVTNYKSPDDPKFYLNYNKANEAQTGQPSFKMDPHDGTITWDAPGAVGQYNIAFNVVEWRKKGQWIKMGYVRRDMQIIIDDCQNKRPDEIVPKDTCVEAGTILKAKILGTDPDKDPVKFDVYSEIFNFAPSQSPATVSPLPLSAYRPTNVHPDTLYFTWNTICAHVKQQPYQVTFKITDQSKSGSSLVTFKTWLITVVAPAPKWQSALLVSKRNASLQWENYQCEVAADTMQVWRRENKFNFVPANCQTGMPPYLGYTLIAKVSIKDTTYLDKNGGKGLAPGATYCYRLVAQFPQPKGGLSYVSKEICVDPIPADAPIITNVSVDKTSAAAGAMRVRWRKPFDANPAQFPPPYRYDVYRGIGFATAPGPATVFSGTDTTFVDTDLNTKDHPYNYTVIGYDKNGSVIDTAAVASSVWLNTRSPIKEIELDWTAFVPWSNDTQSYPWHVIYRGPEGASESDLVKIDSVNVNLRGFVYVDRGQYQNIPLDDSKTYCYRIMTRGAYGNPHIDEPLNNFSQIICTQTGDSIAPCKPIVPVAIQAVDCNDYVSRTETCGRKLFSNTISWTRVQGSSCRNDVRSYNVYASNSANGNFTLIPGAENLTDTVYVDSGLPYFARCYRISAVDRSGNESVLSDALCFENCPYYELPNVFTPNSSDSCNARFSAYSDNSRYVTGKGLICGGVTDPAKCARFVEAVVFHVYNRWGKEVYTYQGYVGDTKNTIYIDWDGRDNDGAELTSAVYYYLAEVTFDATDPRKQHQTLKGWVHLIR